MCFTAYTASEAEDQGRRLEQQLRLKEDEKGAEIARLQEQMRQLATEKDRLASQKQREIAELRSQLQTSHKPPVQRGREAMTVSRPKASIIEGLSQGCIITMHHNLAIFL